MGRCHPMDIDIRRRTMPRGEVRRGTKNLRGIVKMKQLIGKCIDAQGGHLVVRLFKDNG